jgi:methylated-DNA-protein-cysteine methyltransferase-like protein
MSNGNERPLFERIYDIVRQIPPGRVATYGQIAKIVGGCSAQMIGFALAALPDRPERDRPPVPWQRVINAKGKISPHGFGYGSALQEQLLLAEGIRFTPEGTIDFAEFGWIT